MAIIKKVLLSTGFDCNNNCIICSVAHCKRSMPQDATEINASLRNKKMLGYDSIELTGGEPTIRKDICRIIFFARKLGFKNISLTTNGRMFSYIEFCKKVSDSGLEELSFSLLGDKPAVHDAITRATGSFDQLISGIKNIRKFIGIENITVNTVITRLNFKRIKHMALLISGLGIKHWEIQSLLPEGSAKKIYAHYTIDLRKVDSFIKDLEKYSVSFDCVSFHDFPFCVFPRKMFENNRFRIPSDNNTLSLGKRNAGQVTMESAKNKYRTKLPFCNNCNLKNGCPGICKEYLATFGQSFLNNIEKENLAPS